MISTVAPRLDNDTHALPALMVFEY